jgi:hypothetical protein
METECFDRRTRTISCILTRRTLAGAFGLGAFLLSSSAEARKHKHKHKKKVNFNDFGCVDVGRFCQSANQCCSGICQGTKGKKRCQAHDVEGCQAGQTIELCGSGPEQICTTSAGGKRACLTTTGNAGYCAGSSICAPCQHDADCEALCGLHAACVSCTACPDGGTLCAGLAATACFEERAAISPIGLRER